MVDNKPKVDNFTNVNSMLKKVYNWMDHLNPYRHGLGTVMVTHHMYFVLKNWKHCAPLAVVFATILTNHN